MFNERLAFGKLGESKIASWLRNRGNYVLPVYETEMKYKGPRLYAPTREIISPDLLVFSHEGVRWIEAKHKTVFTWHRITKRWTTGIDRRHYREYLSLAEEFPWPIWLLFLHESEEPNNRDKEYCPKKCPTGLYGGDILELNDSINHEHDGHGKSGMVYWALESLIELATLQEVNSATKS